MCSRSYDSIYILDHMPFCRITCATEDEKHDIDHSHLPGDQISKDFPVVYDIFAFVGKDGVQGLVMSDFQDLHIL